MFGRRNPDRPLDPPLPDGQEIEDLNLDLLDDLPDIVEPENAKPAESAPAAPVPQEQPAAPAAEPAWQPAPSILGPSVTRMLQTRPTRRRRGGCRAAHRPQLAAAAHAGSAGVSGSAARSSRALRAAGAHACRRPVAASRRPRRSR